MRGFRYLMLVSVVVVLWKFERFIFWLTPKNMQKQNVAVETKLDTQDERETILSFGNKEVSLHYQFAAETSNNTGSDIGDSNVESTKAAEHAGDIKPWIVLQYGPPRTATTFQFQILCASMFVKLLEQGDEIVKKFSCEFSTMLRPFPDLRPALIKTHDMQNFPPSLGVWLFITTNVGSDSHAVHDEYKFKGYDIKYVQEMERVQRLGHGIVYDYQNVFNLTNSQVEDVAEYIKYWQILRRCCGIQMSRDWREQLLPLEKKDPSFTVHNKMHSPSYPACHMYNIDQVEELFLSTSIAKSKSTFLRMEDTNKPAEMDDDLDGTYCSRYNAAVSRHGLGFNERIPVP